MEVRVIKQAQREIDDFPPDVKQSIQSLIDELALGKSLGLPTSRPLPSIAKHLHELRVKGRAGEFRVFYVIRIGDAIYIVHAMTKKTQALDRQTVETLRARLGNL